MTNKEIADVFEEIAELLEIKGENPFRIRAYQKANLTIANLPYSVVDVYNNKGKDVLMKIPGIGSGIADKIEELIKNNGMLEYLDRLKKEIPESLTELMKVPGLGPKKVKLFYDKLEIKSIEDLEKAIKEEKLKDLEGIREKSIENILKGIELRKKSKGRITLGVALPLAETIVKELKSMKEVAKISYAGSLRRGKETVRDIDILITSKKPEIVMKVFISLPIVKEILAHGETKSSILTRENIQVDLRVVEPESFGACLLYFTGSKEHNIRLRERAIKIGLKINEYGVFRNKDNKKIAGLTEEEIYKSLNLQFIPPELREDRGEVEASENRDIPELIEEKDIKGDLHIHSKATDGNEEIEEIAEYVLEKGYEYIAITDHSQSLKMVHGLTSYELLKHSEEIRKVNNKFKNIQILTGSEVDIKVDGKLDYDDSVLAELDFIVASIHSNFNLDRKVMTDRIKKAINNKYVTVIGHLTGRLLGERDAYELDIEEILKECKIAGTMLELNAYPNRLDLNDINLKLVKDSGVKIVISTDAHNKHQLDFMNFGVITAKRGWLEKKDVANTYSFTDFLKLLKNKK